MKTRLNIWPKIVSHPPEHVYRNLHIFFSAMIGRKSLRSIGRLYGISGARVKMIVLQEAKRRAPVLYSELIALKYKSCSRYDQGQGPTMFELLKFKEQFIYGEIF